MSAIAIGGTYYTEFSLVAPVAPNQGSAINADTLPTIQLIRNGVVDTEIMPTVVNMTTGRYSVTFVVPSDWKILDNITVVILATINSTVYRNFHDTIVIFGVLSSPYNPSSTVTRQMVEQVYGASNIARWADADNDNDPTKIAERIAWCINKADLYVEGKLSLMYQVPMSPMPALLAEMVAERAGALVYLSPRALAEGTDELGNIEYHVKQVDMQISDLLSGTLRFTDSPTTCTTIPVAINDHTAQWLNNPWMPYGSPYAPFTQIPGTWIPLPESLFYQT